jgi:DNA phosphorothioation-dependent restriction protein DptG
MSTKLSDRVVARCNADKLPDNHMLRIRAAQFNEACSLADRDKEDTKESAKKILGSWARLRKAWQEYSGESWI